MDDDYRQYKQWLGPLDNYLVRVVRITKKGIYEAAEEYKQKLEHGSFMEIYKSLWVFTV